MRRAFVERSTVCLLVALLLPVAGAWAKSLEAERFDVRARLALDRSITVEETVVFLMVDGPFTTAWREVPLRRVDGIVDVVARMDGAVLPRGTGPGQVEVTYGRDLRVTWHFAPTSGRHEFSLTYRMLGVATTTPSGDRLTWVALPETHSYAIGEASVAVSWPDTLRLTGTPGVKPATAAVSVGARELRVVAGPLRKNMVVRIDADFPPGAFLGPPPAWQGALDAQRQRGPWLLLVAAVVLAAGFGWLAAFRAAWSRPPSESGSSAPIASGPPRPDLPTAVAARLAGRGTRLQQMIATIVDLAARGVVRIEERQPAVRLLGRSFEVQLVTEPSSPEPHEAAVLDVLFGRVGHRRSATTWRRLQQQANNKSWAFGRALLETMRRAGFVDEERVAARRTLGRAAAAVAILVGLTVILAGVLLPLFGGWGFVVPAAVSAVAIGFAAGAASLSILSRRGEDEARRWKGFLKALEESVRAKDTPRPVPPDWLRWAIAAGVGHLAAKRLAGPVPPWFRPMAAGEDGTVAFAALLHTSGAAGAHDGAAASAADAGGAAGGGSSGAN